jgi:hypothetical protein
MMSKIFSVITLSNSKTIQRFGRTYGLHLQNRSESQGRRKRKQAERYVPVSEARITQQTCNLEVIEASRDFTKVVSCFSSVPLENIWIANT